MSRNAASVARREKSALPRRYFGIGSGATAGVGSSTGTGAESATADVGDGILETCVILWDWKQDSEQLR